MNQDFKEFFKSLNALRVEFLAHATGGMGKLDFARWDVHPEPCSGGRQRRVCRRSRHEQSVLLQGLERSGLQRQLDSLGGDFASSPGAAVFSLSGSTRLLSLVGRTPTGKLAYRKLIGSSWAPSWVELPNAGSFSGDPDISANDPFSLRIAITINGVPSVVPYAL